MDALGLELGLHAWGLLLDALTVSQLKQTLIRKKLPSSGTKSELKGRVISSGLSPSRVLGILSTEELRKLCSSLAGVPVSGSKAVRIQRIIGYFANLITKEVSDEASPGERFYKYLPELARRDRENLLANQIIRKDHRYRARIRGGNPVPLRIKAGAQADGDDRQRAPRRLHPVRRTSEGRWGRADVGQQEHGDRLHVSAVAPEAVQPPLFTNGREARRREAASALDSEC